MDAVTAKELASRGADIAVSYFQSAGASEALIADVRAAGRRGHAIRSNLRSFDQCPRLVHDTVADLGRLDVFIHMASHYHRISLEKIGPEDWDAPIDVD